jgi:hypothetical protein
MQQSKLDLNSMRMIITTLQYNMDINIEYFEGKYDKNECGKDDVDIAGFHQNNIILLQEAKRLLDKADSKLHDIELNIWARE